MLTEQENKQQLNKDINFNENGVTLMNSIQTIWFRHNTNDFFHKLKVSELSAGKRMKQLRKNELQVVPVIRQERKAWGGFDGEEIKGLWNADHERIEVHTKVILQKTLKQAGQGGTYGTNKVWKPTKTR